MHVTKENREEQNTKDTALSYTKMDLEPFRLVLTIGSSVKATIILAILMRMP